MVEKGIEGSSDESTRFSGDDLLAMFATASRLLEHNVESINALNVFPVPDGDTGTNMFLTLRDTLKEVDGLRGGRADEVAQGMSKGALMGARGNSGVILSQFFKGVSVGLDESPDFGADELVRAFHQARDHAYKAVGEPVEGTILTVISSVADAAQRALDDGSGPIRILEAACEAARDAVARTPTLLPVLRDAGVVDAGGQGLAVILEGLRRCAADEGLEELEVASPAPIGLDGATGTVAADFLDTAEGEEYGYCTQFMVIGVALDLDAIKSDMNAVAHSTVVVGDETTARVHVHTDEPDRAVAAGGSHGTLSEVNIRDMDEQRKEFSAARRQEVAKPVAVVAVAWGEGLEELFKSLGADEIVTGGDTMNPSVKDLMDAVDRAPSKNVIVLPNNKNIVPAAEQAATSSEKDVRVVPSITIPQGVSAMLNLVVESDVDSNVREMASAITSVQTGEVTTAVRKATIDGLAVQAGKLIGLLDHTLVATGEGLEQVTLAMLEQAEIPEGSLVALYRGEPVTQGEADSVSASIEAARPDVEVEVVYGGQPHYHFIVSIE